MWVGFNQQDWFIGDETLQRPGFLRLNHPIENGVFKFFGMDEGEDERSQHRYRKLVLARKRMVQHVFGLLFDAFHAPVLHSQLRENDGGPEVEHVVHNPVSGALETLLRQGFSESVHPGTILLTEPIHASLASREGNTEHFFEETHVDALCLADTATLAVLGHAETSGIVLDVGATMVTAAVVTDGRAVRETHQEMFFGGRDLVERYQSVLEERGVAKMPFGPSEKVMQKMFYVAENFEDEMLRFEAQRHCDDTYEMPDGTKLSVSHERFSIPELLFSDPLPRADHRDEGFAEDLTRITVSSLLSKLLSVKEDGDSHRVDRIFACGGVSRMEGFDRRLQSEVNQLMQKNARTETRGIRVIGKEKSHRTFAAFQGGHVLASLSTFPSMCMTRSEYQEFGKALLHRKCL